MEWAIEVCLETGLPVAASMCIGPEGDLHGVSSAECAVRMAKAGANVGKWVLINNSGAIVTFWLTILHKLGFGF